MKLQVLTWTPSRYAKWKECPRKVLHEDLEKRCPACFKGTLSGGFGTPVVCSKCKLPQPERGPLDRGNRLDAAMTVYLGGHGAVEASLRPTGADLTEATQHPKIKALANKLRRAKGVSKQLKIVLDSQWRQVSQFTKNAWARLTLDVLHLTPKVAKVIDWKSGNIDKRTGEIREKDEYHDSMLAYQMAVLSIYPQSEATATMAFLDAPKNILPFKEVPTLQRKDLDLARKRWEEKLKPMFVDDVFPPRPGYYCGWCPFSKKNRGGPCKAG